MTSRVQKGGPIFRPVAKSRVAATGSGSRQASTPAPASSRESLIPTGDATPTVSPLPAPPPTARGFDDVALVAESSQPGSSSTIPPAPAVSGSRVSAPPVIAKASRTALNPFSLPRSSPAPPPIASRAASTVSALREPPTPSPTLVNSTADRTLNASIQDDSEFPEDLSQFIAPNPSTTVDPLSENHAKSPVQKKTRKRKQKDVDGGAIAPDGETAEQPKKARKKQTKRNVKDPSDSTQPRLRRKRKRAETAGEGCDTTESPRPKKSRKKSTQPVFDPDADPGEELDPTVVTMAELCADNGQGRISSKALDIQKNHLAWKQQSKEKRAKMKALAERKKYGGPEEEPEEETGPSATNAVDDGAEVIGLSEPSQSEPAIADASGSGFDYSQDLTKSRFTVQVRIGPNGETIIDEESLTVDRTEDVDTSNYVHVVESDHTKFVNSASYGKKCRGSRWSAEETDLFFEALSQHGENYELISLVLPGRSRTACKNKFKAEDKKNSARITRCLENRIPIDMQTLARLTGRDFSGPTPIITAPTPPPMPDQNMEPEPQPETSAARKRSRSRTIPSAEVEQIIGDADTYNET
ncbi:hypothetical protein GGX14DRAFT_419864 [Mycena pura]|uniref:Myb-like domain-containing protein n=1 Tax=Mycena pura TaxID=153505 RepID=A0AAD6YNU4_9AGAR|nr:hypothetical protein GGX14DRAFT_419864 [Mycena pura]